MVGRGSRNHASWHELIPERINPVWTQQQLCDFSEHWKISPVLADKLYQLAQRLPFSISIISGYRSRAHQDELRASGRPAAANDVSTHTSCPATGADISVALYADGAVKLEVGHQATLLGLRWGGGSPPPLDRGGIPVDWNHFDLGRR